MHLQKLIASGVVLLACSFAFAVQWTGTSGSFRWTVTGTLGGGSAPVKQAVLQCRADMVKGLVTIGYRMPSAAPAGKLAIYNVNGLLVKSFAVRPQERSVRWDIASDHVAAGVYVASLRYGAIEYTAQLSIFK